MLVKIISTHPKTHYGVDLFLTVYADSRKCTICMVSLHSAFMSNLDQLATFPNMTLEPFHAGLNSWQPLQPLQRQSLQQA